MSVLSRVNWTAQQRVDLHHMLMQESFTAFDFRSIVSTFVGTDKTYVIRGFQVVGKTGLSIQIRVADSQVFNPRDNNGSFYLGLSDDDDITVDLPADQANIFVEGRFRNVTQAPVNTAFWDPLALTGEDASGTEFSASTNTQNITVLEISVNTIGFSEGAVPLLVASTNASSITAMEDRINYMWRLGTGGSTPNPLHKYDWATSRGESVPSGTGVGDAVDSPWRARDSVGAINDKAFRSLKEWADAVMTRISEISGSALWYASGVTTAPVANVSLNEVFFDTLGHNINPSPQAAFIWKRVTGSLRLAGEGTVPTVSGSHHVGLIKWQSNYSKLEWHLGGVFASSTFRNYASGQVRFTSPAPVDQGNVYLKLEREVPKGSGAPVSWADNTAEPSFVSTKAVSGQAGDFTGIALGDFIRKESEGYSRYYRIVKMSDGSTIYDNAVVTDENRVADATIVALELEDIILGALSTEPLRYFRARYSNDDLYADTSVGVYLYQDADFYWLGRRKDELFTLRGYGTMQENEEATTLNDAWDGLGAGGDGSLVVEHALQAYYDASAGYALKTGSGTLITLRRRKRDNTVGTPSSSDNTNALLTYTIAAPVGLMSVGDQLWVRLSDTTGGALTSGVVTNSTDELDNTDTVTNTWEIRPATTTPLRTFDDKDVFLLARRVTIGGQAALLFTDSTVLGAYGRLINENVEITGETKLTPRSQQGILFISETISGQVDDEVAQLFYTRSSGTVGMRTFRVTDNNILLSAAASVNFLTNLGNNTLTMGSANSTTYIPGDLVVAGNTVAAQVSQIQSEDKLITLGVGNLVNEGYNSGIEVADNTINGTLFASTNTSPDVVITLASAPGYSLGDVIGVSATTGIGGITAGEIGGQYTIVASLVSPGDATISGSTLTVRTAVAATSTTSSGVTPPKAFKAEWAFKVTGSDGSLTGFTSWMFQVKGVATKPTITPVASYGTVATSHSVNMQSTRIPFVNNDNSGPAGADSTLNYTANLTWDNGTNTFTVVGSMSISGNILPGTDDTYDLGTPLLRWNALYLGQAAGGGLFAGPAADINLYWASSGLWKTDDSLEVAGQLQTNEWLQMLQQATFPAAPASGLTRIWSDDDRFVYQRTADGEVKLLTNEGGNVYEEVVQVVAAPVGDNQMAALLSPPTIVTLPKDRHRFVGAYLTVTTANTFTLVTVNKIAHGLSNGDLVTVLTSTAVGGISAANLSVTNAVVSGVTSNTFKYNATAAATSSTSGSLDKVEAIMTRYYLVGDQSLEVYINGELMTRAVDYTEVGVSGAQSNSIQWQVTLEEGDDVTYRIDSNGGQVVILSGGSGSLQAAYNAGNSLTTVSGTPFTINGPAAEKIFVVNGDITVTGVIDPKGIQFSLEASQPFSGTQYGIWVSNTGHLMFERATDPVLNISEAIVGGLPSTSSSATFENNQGSTINKATPVSINSLSDMQFINVSIEANALACVGLASDNVLDTASGAITTSGRLTDISTSATYGDVLYVSKTGGLTNVKPSTGIAGFVSGDYIISVGVVVENDGTPGLKDILVRIQVVGQT